MRTAVALGAALLMLSLVAASTSAAGKAQDCGDANDDNKITSSDALLDLRTALDLDSCEPCRCDVDGSGNIVTADALAILSVSVGGSVDFDCPACVTTTTTTTTLPVFVPCGDPRAGAPNCDGYCGVDGQMCVESPPFSGNCQCIFTPIPCGVAEGPPICAGSCPKTRVCRHIATTCECTVF
jgi:hypothetical protein